MISKTFFVLCVEKGVLASSKTFEKHFYVLIFLCFFFQDDPTTSATYEEKILSHELEETPEFQVQCGDRIWVDKTMTHVWKRVVTDVKAKVKEIDPENKK